jgi:UDP-N-acetyl-2-amino-2-deoxyglucuronate dehydrogenase
LPGAGKYIKPAAANSPIAVTSTAGAVLTRAKQQHTNDSFMKFIGILGGGNISETHARAVQATEGVAIAAFYGANQERVKRLSGMFGGATYSDLDTFLAHKPMDIVAIGSPSGLHAEQGIAAANMGLQVLVEKPIDITIARVDAFIAACSRARVKLGVFFQDRMAPDVETMKEVIDSGRLGRPILASARVKWFRSQDYYSDSKWRGTLALDGGGALMNQGIHTVDLLLWLMGDVRRVQAHAVTALHRIELEDTVVATLEFANGAIGTLEAATSVYPGYPRRLELTGSEGTLVLENDRLIAADLREPLANWERPITELDENTSSPVVSNIRGHQRVLEDFLKAIESDGRPRCDGIEGRRSVALVEAIYASSREGRPVYVNATCDG